MPLTIQARLDDESQQTLNELLKRLGWSPSQAVREGLRLLAACHLGDRRRSIVGTGKFASGTHDLGSNKSHLKDFGR
jgi:hypothetical protein